MGQAVLSGNPPIAINLRRSGRARRISLRISRLDGRVTLTLPPRVPEREAMAFASQKEGWIRTALAAQPVREEVGPGTVLPFAGATLQLEPAPVRTALAQGDRLLVPEGREAKAALAYLREESRRRLLAASESFADKLGHSVGRITLRDTRSRWGSCSSAGHLMYSWRLILAPPEVLDYVAAHEVAHLKHMDHSPRFWAVVEQIRPGWKAQRDWLRREGPDLHRFRFGN